MLLGEKKVNACPQAVGYRWAVISYNNFAFILILIHIYFVFFTDHLADYRKSGFEQNHWSVYDYTIVLEI